jgi:hypothetical protein
MGELLRATAKEHTLFGSDWPLCDDRVVAEEIALLEAPNFLGEEDVGPLKKLARNHWESFSFNVLH